MCKPQYQITIVESNQQTIVQTAKNQKAKNKWLYQYLLNHEKMWLWQEWLKTDYKTFDKWFDDFFKPAKEWQNSETHFYRINKKIIMIKNLKK